MSISDPIGDGLTKIRNASRAKHPVVDIRFSRLFVQILDVLKREGFIRAYKLTGDTPAQRAMSAGRLSIIAFQTLRASS